MSTNPSHDQSAVNRIFITRVPENYFLQDMSQYVPDTRDLKNIIKRPGVSKRIQL